MLSLQQISDRLEIQQLLVDYCNAIDRRDYDRLDQVFTPDAYIDYRKLGGVDGRYPEIKQWLKPALEHFPHYFHSVGNMDIRVDGDRATARTPCTNPMVLADADGADKVWLIGLWYDDELVRTADGWRFTSRRQERCYSVVGLQDTPLGPA